MKPLILLVDDDPSILEINTETLEEAGYEVLTAANGNAAKLLFKERNIKAVLSDIRMSECDGVELFRWANEQKIVTPFIFLTGFSSVAEAKELANMGARAILPKPLSRDDLLKAIKQALDPKAKTDLITFENSKYARVSIEDFLFGKNIPFAVYVKISNDKLVKVSHAGENLNLDRIQTMKAKGLTDFWLHVDDFKKYTEIASKIRDIALPQAQLTKDKKVRLVNHAVEVAFEQMRISGIDPAVYKNAEATLQQTLTAFSESDLGTALLDNIEKRGNSPFGHAACCAAFAALICKVMAWSSQKNVMLLTMGAYVHDIGMLALPLELQEKEPLLMTKEEREMYNRHPTYGAAEIRKIPDAPQHLATIIEQHHENGTARGFPKGLSRLDIFPMASIIHFIDEFSEKLVKPLPKANPGDPKPPSDKIANSKAIHILELIKKDKNAFYDKSAALALELLLKYNDVSLAKSMFEKQSGTGFNRS